MAESGQPTRMVLRETAGSAQLQEVSLGEAPHDSSIDTELKCKGPNRTLETHRKPVHMVSKESNGGLRGRRI